MDGRVNGSGASVSNIGSAGSAGKPLLTTTWLAAQTVSWPTVLFAVFAGYVLLCSALRFRFERAMRRKFPYPDRASLARMTLDDAQAILGYIIQYEFPYLYKLSIQFGIFKTYTFPSISRLVWATGSLKDVKRAAKRYEDTVTLFAEFSLNPPTSDRCLKAIARMNYLHSRYQASGAIRNADLLYTLSVCITEPARFMAQYEWRPLNEMERCALGVFWKALGDAMQIDYAGALARAPAKAGAADGGSSGSSGSSGWHDGLEFTDDITAWARQYEREAMRPDPVNTKLARTFVDLLLWYLPHAVRPFFLEVLTVLMGDRVRDAFSYPEPGIVASAVTCTALVARRFYLRYLALPRIGLYRPTSAAADPQTGRIHLNEYMLEPWYNRPTVWNRWGPMALLTRALGGTVPGNRRHREEQQQPGGKAAAAATSFDGVTFLPEGFLFEDIGPFNRMGSGVAEGAAEEARLRTARSSGCPFA
ncbi:hypothetical protein SPI_02697 [Niveomyces insectorum RCEF 264]|uniref:ER-bound oxygenase mpaB/mpaB'/Rubber oxygenase catalytic domain-containing protein n=1 Tax=Niveomyces insectorum RCEF 264 TaxID=1081102 RepID=A0A162MRS3_9HYPO|nr:hypothetical protein SPI_02697 [Niveomyces insectorum RCEF 264]